MATVLRNARLEALWQTELKEMSDRITAMRRVRAPAPLYLREGHGVSD